MATQRRFIPFTNPFIFYTACKRTFFIPKFVHLLQDTLCTSGVSAWTAAWLPRRAINSKRDYPPAVRRIKPPRRLSNQVKYTIAFDGLTACDFNVYTDPCYTSEDRAIPEIVWMNASREGSTANIYTFDRGVSANVNYCFL